MGLNVLVIDRAPPASITQGNSLIARRVFPLLGHHRLTLFCPTLPAAVATDSDAAALASVAEYFDDVLGVPRRRPVSALGGWLAHASAARAPWAPGDAGRFVTRVRGAAAGRHFDVVHVRQLPMAPLGRVVEASGRILELVDSEALGSARTSRLAKSSNAGAVDLLRGRVRAAAARSIERRAMAGYDVVTTVAERDGDALRRMEPEARVVVVPNGVDADEFRPLELPEVPGRIAFVGAMSYPPNIAAARFLATEVLPRVRTLGVSVELVGRSPADGVVRLAGGRVAVTGSVADVRPHLARAELVVIPMLSGSGIKNKVLEAMAMGRPVVATPLAVEGIALERGDELEVADGADAIATAVDRLLADPAARLEMGRRARELVMRRYTWDACAAVYDRLYRELAESPFTRRR